MTAIARTSTFGNDKSLSHQNTKTKKLTNLCKLFISDLTSHQIIDRNAKNFFFGIST